MRKFSHRPATLVNRERRNPLFFFPTYSAFTYLTKRNSKLWGFMSPPSDRVEFFSSRRAKSTTVSLHRPSFPRFRCLSSHSRSRPGKRRRGKKPTTLLRPTATPRLRGTRFNYRSYFSFFPSSFSTLSLCCDHRAEAQRDGLFLHDSRKSAGVARMTKTVVREAVRNLKSLFKWLVPIIFL